MNVQVEPLPNCLATLRVDLPPDAVNAAREDITRDYAANAKLPGYRPGKAPRAVVERKFQKQIREELERKLLSESTRAAITEKTCACSSPECRGRRICARSIPSLYRHVVTVPDSSCPSTGTSR